MRHTTIFSRRKFLRTGVAALASCSAGMALAAPSKKPAVKGAPALPSPPAQFNHGYVEDLAKALAARPYEANSGAVPDVLRSLPAEAYNDLKFRGERAFFADSGSPFRLQLYHLGYLYSRAVAINLVNNGVSYAVPYSTDLFDYGRNAFEPPLPVNLGYAGFRLHYPLNRPNDQDELISFLGASNFRLLGRGQRYGLNARGLSIDTGLPSGEEFPYFREFWIETPPGSAKSINVHALLDSPSLTGAYHFIITPGKESGIDVKATLFPRKAVHKLGLSPLASMFYYSEQQGKPADDYRPEVHDSDGLLIHNGADEWLWRPLRNPAQLAISDFVDNNLRGFGLMQRDRSFDHYQDLNVHSELRPSYWIEPAGNWGEGMAELVEIPTPDENNDNILAYWVPKAMPKPGEVFSFAYRLRSLGMLSDENKHPGGRVIATYSRRLLAHEAPEASDAAVRRFLIDFSGGDLAFYLQNPDSVSVMTSSSSGTILRSFVTANPDIKGFRAIFDLKAQPDLTADLRAYLRAGDTALSETWIYPWRYES